MRYLKTLNRRFHIAFLLITTCFLVPSCSEKTKTKQKEKEEVKTEKTVTNINADLKQNIPTNFKEFLDFVPTKQLPIRATCGFNDVISPTSIPEKFHKWTKNQFGIYGKLTSKENIHYVLYGGISEIFVPYLYTYDNTGTVIDSIALISGACGSDPEVVFSTSLIIDTNLHITTIDSGYNYSYIESETDYFRTLDSVDVIISETQIKPNGKTPPLSEVSKFLVNNKTYSGQSIVYYWAPSGKLEKMKEKYGEENFYTSADDVVFYSSQLQELVDSLEIKSYKDSIGTIGFIGTHSEYQANLAKTFEGEIFGAIYFDGVNPPEKLDILDPEIKLLVESDFKFKEEFWAYEFMKGTQVYLNSSSLDTTSTECGSWFYPDDISISDIFTNLKWQHNSDIHYVFETYPCSINGELQSNNIKYSFSLNAGGYMNIYNDEKSFSMGIDNPKLSKYFLSIKTTPEELEKLMED